MVSTNSTLAFFIGVLYFNTANATSCRTPDYDSGECKPIEDCPALRSATFRIEGQFEIKETSQFLKNSVCKSDSDVELVCCPNENSLKEVKPLENTQNDVLPDPDTCGISHAEDGYSRIVGGFNVSRGQFPWIVAMGYDRDIGKASYECGASLIAPNHVLTAAHCIVGQPLIQVAIGTLNPYKDPYLTGKVVKTYVHEDYSEVTNENDIAVVKVQWQNEKGENVDFKPNETADTICLPKTEDLRTKTYERYYPFISGWGLQEYDNLNTVSAILLAVQVPVVKNTLCEKKYQKFKRTIISPNVLCAGYMKEKHDSCQGDSGGPLMLPILNNGETRYYQIGVVSKGYRCAYPGMPAIYTRVGNYIDWIVSKIVL
ncbi:venom protease-like [Chrysoperla carnea]|uniref:venom protease-like n=1 Tax=Chrysoperla carnea TaxID=189513 RepID=UPI001D066260|nr:venom protease-like [Chrysoperla carnea]